MTARRTAAVLIGSEIGLAALFGITGALHGFHGTAYAAVSPQGDTATQGPQEDQPGWSCVDDGNRVCGPGNANGVPAGCYDDGGVMVVPWPCHVVPDADGVHRDVFTGPPMA